MNKRFKLITAASLIVWFFLFTPLLLLTFAQTKESNCVETKIGNPPPNTPGCGGSGTGTTGPCGTVVDFSGQITANLNPTDSLNKEITSNCGKTTPRGSWVSGIYWCAYNVVDSYNLAGIKGLSGASVIGIHTQMQGNSAFTFVDYRTNKQAGLQQVKPGWAFMIERNFGQHTSGGQHTGIIKSITLDERGNGTIITLESNGGKTSNTWPVANWVVQLRDTRPLAAFGGAK